MKNYLLTAIFYVESFSDEFVFLVYGITNRQKTRISGSKNEKEI